MKNPPAPTTEAAPRCAMCGRILTSGSGTPSHFGLLGPECAQKTEVTDLTQIISALPGQTVQEHNLQGTGQTLNALKALGLQITHTRIEGGWRIEAVTVPRPAKAARRGWAGPLLARYEASHDRIADLMRAAFPTYQENN